jgi:hypothetical protein
MRIRPFVLAVLLGLLVAATSGCQPSVSGAALSATDAPPLPGVEGMTDSPETGMQYLRSEERDAHFDVAFTNTAELLVRGMEKGKLGNIVRYDDYARPVADDYTGWGLLNTADGAETMAFAWLYYKDGRALIDSNHPVLGAGITPSEGLSVDIGRNIQECGTNQEECTSLPTWFPWVVQLQSEEFPTMVRVSDPDFIGQGTYPGNDAVVLSVTLEELRQLDIDALTTFEQEVAEALTD